MSLVTVTAQKESQDSKAGLALANNVRRTENENGQHIVVESIDETSIFADTALQPNFIIVKVNNVPVEDLSVDQTIDLIQNATGTVTILARERYGNQVSATVTKTSRDMKVGIIFATDETSDFATYIMEFVDTSPFKGKLPSGPSHEIVNINGENVQRQTPQDIANAIANVPQGPLTIEMTKLETKKTTTEAARKRKDHGAPVPRRVDAFTPPNCPSGGRWDKVRYVGSKTCIMSVLCCLCFGIPGLLVLCCPCDEQNVYRVNGEAYDANGNLVDVPTD